MIVSDLNCLSYYEMLWGLASMHQDSLYYTATLPGDINTLNIMKNWKLNPLKFFVFFLLLLNWYES